MNIANRKTTLCLVIASLLAMSGCNSSNRSTPIALALDEIRDELIIDLAGYHVESLSDEVLLMGETIAASDSNSTLLEPGSFSIVVRDEPMGTPTERISYDCSQGGTVIAEVGRQRINESSYSNHADHDSYLFDQCRLSPPDTDPLLDAPVSDAPVSVLNGSVRVLTNDVSASRGGFANREVQWIDFSMEQQSINRNVSGTAMININRLLSFDNQEERVVTIDRFDASENGNLERRIVDGSMTLAISTVGSGAVRNFDLQTQGQVTTGAEVPVQIATDQPLSASQTQDGDTDFAEPFTGVLSMSADDGSRLTMTAQPIRAWGPKLVDIGYISSAGDEKTLSGVEFPELTISAP